MLVINKLSAKLSRFFVSVLCVFLSQLALAGGEFEQLIQLVNPADTTDEIIPYDGRGLRWDERCLPTNFVIDSDSLPNAGTENEIDIETVKSVIADAMQTWTNVPTSYIEPKIGEVRPITGAGIGFDYVFTITFEEALPTGIFGEAPSVTLDLDRVMEPGEDLDQDGDSDVYDAELVGRTDCFDVDGDGDIEFSSGFYRGGTILDADISFSSLIDWTTNIEDVGFDFDTFTLSVDIFSVAIHELGHTLGLAHSLIGMRSETDGRNAIMFPFVTTNPRGAEATRELSDDDIAWISFVYPEGSSDKGLAALQEGDIAFDQVFDIIEGTVMAAGSPNMLGHIIARGKGRTKDVTIGGYSTNPPILGDRDFTFVDLAVDEVTAESARYFIPVPKGKYTLEIEEIDGAPLTPAQITIPTVIASFFDGNETISDNFFSGDFRDRLERESQFFVKRDFPRVVPSFRRSPANFNLPEAVRIGSLSNPVFSVIGQAGSGGWLVRRFEREEVLQQLNVGNLLAGARIFTRNHFGASALDWSAIPAFGGVKLAVGTVDENDELQLEFFEDIVDSFIGDENDHTYLRLSPSVGKLVEIYLEYIAPDADLYLATELIQTPDFEGNLDVSTVGGNVVFGADTSFSSVSLEGPFSPLPFFDLGINLDFRVPAGL